MKLDNEIPKNVEDQRNVDIITKLEWLTQPRVVFKAQPRFSFVCFFNKTFDMKVVFLNKKKNYTLRFPCPEKDNK